MLATTVGVAAVVVGGIVGPGLLLAAGVIAPAAAARVTRRLMVATALLALPIAVSAALVNVFFLPGGATPVATIGPLVITLAGIHLALEVVIRIVTISGAVTLLYLTTRPAELVNDLERRGVSRRVAFVANASVRTVPAMVARAREITDAQRARGLDTEGGPLRRARGVIPIVGPVILGAIGEVEERTMALEARAFTTPGTRTLLWSPADSGRQRLARWAMVIGLAALVAHRVAGNLV
jgi:energy-coupling factor transport system permease protein